MSSKNTGCQCSFSVSHKYLLATTHKYQSMGGKMENEKKFDEKQPAFTRSLGLSKDGNWLILRTIRTDIIHVKYLDKVLGN